jgi:hypothetical protein
VNLSYLGNYPTNAQLNNTLLGYITTGYATAFLLLQSVAEATYQPIALMSNYITNSQLITALADYTLLSTFNSTIATLVTSVFLQSNYYTANTINSLFLTITAFNNQIVNYVTSSSLATTLSDYVSNSSLANTLNSYYTSAQIDSLFSALSSVYLSISSFNSQIANYVLQSSLTT